MGGFLALLSTLNTLLDRFVSCVCVCQYVCVWMLNSVYVCFLISVAATRSYSRSTGALHTPDAFGAAGEGWVHLFLCTSPTHFALIFVRSVLFLFSFVPRIFSCISSTFFSFRVHWPRVVFYFLFLNILFQDVEPASGIACFRPFSCQLTTILPVSPASICSFYLALSLLCGDTQRVLLCFMSIIHSPTSGTCNVP